MIIFMIAVVSTVGFFIREKMLHFVAGRRGSAFPLGRDADERSSARVRRPSSRPAAAALPLASAESESYDSPDQNTLAAHRRTHTLAHTPARRAARIARSETGAGSP